MRVAIVERKTKETRIKMRLNLDGRGKSKISSQIGFLNHMLEAFSKHGAFDLDALVDGDLNVDQHHTTEDVGITLGEAFRKALGNKKGINRAGFFVFPMDESLSLVAVDISGRPYLRLDAKFLGKNVGGFNTELLEDFLRGFSTSLQATLHVRVVYGRSDHHKIESIFKCLGKAMKQACESERKKSGIPSTKGII